MGTSQKENMFKLTPSLSPENPLRELVISHICVSMDNLFTFPATPNISTRNDCAPTLNETLSPRPRLSLLTHTLTLNPDSPFRSRLFPWRDLYRLFLTPNDACAFRKKAYIFTKSAKLCMSSPALSFAHSSKIAPPPVIFVK